VEPVAVPEPWPPVPNPAAPGVPNPPGVAIEVGATDGAKPANGSNGAPPVTLGREGFAGDLPGGCVLLFGFIRPFLAQ
jgi:hypothetical protein